MGMTMKFRCGIAVVLSATAMTAGCGIVGRDDMAESCAVAIDGDGSDTYWPDAMKDLVSRCDLRPADTFMVSLEDFMREEDYANKTPGEVRAMIAAYRERKGDNLRFLEVDPTSDRALTSVAQARFVFLSLEPTPSAQAVALGPDQFLVDLQTKTIRVAAPGFVLGSGYASAQTSSMTEAQRDTLVGLVERRAGGWSQPPQPIPPADWQPSGYGSWMLVVCDSDYSLHRFQAVDSEGLAPSGFAEFARSFVETVGVA